MRLDQFDGPARTLAGAFGILLGIEARRREVLGAIERKLAIATELARRFRQRIDLRRQRGRQMHTLGQEDAGHIVDARGIDSDGPQQRLERELDDLLGLAYHVGPALRFEEYVHGAQPDFGAPHVVQGKVLAAHQAAPIQYG